MNKIKKLEQSMAKIQSQIDELKKEDKPKLKEEFDLDNLADTCQGYIDYLDSPEYHEDNDYSHFIFEAAMGGLFGSEVWDWINKKTV